MHECSHDLTAEGLRLILPGGYCMPAWHIPQSPRELAHPGLCPHRLEQRPRCVHLVPAQQTGGRQAGAHGVMLKVHVHTHSDRGVTMQYSGPHRATRLPPTPPCPVRAGDVSAQRMESQPPCVRGMHTGDAHTRRGTRCTESVLWCKRSAATPTQTAPHALLLQQGMQPLGRPGYVSTHMSTLCSRIRLVSEPSAPLASACSW